MRRGLYGKLPSRRDFIAIGTPRALLDLWEPWMQGGIAASRQSLGDHWQQAFLTAPIWRFWLGAELCGTTVLGAFMPSLDGVGRYFPLTLFACPEERAAFPPPELDPQDAWFTEVEEFLLATLEQDASFESVTAGLERIVAPSDDNPIPRRDDTIALQGAMAAQVDQHALPDVFAALRLADHANVYAGATFWWTIGGEDFEPLAMSARRMPGPSRFAEMLTGRYAFGFD
jgi:type VI secretion system protein ImpM